jgi:hypothetical protein
MSANVQAIGRPSHAASQSVLSMTAGMSFAAPVGLYLSSRLFSPLSILLLAALIEHSPTRTEVLA